MRCLLLITFVLACVLSKRLPRHIIFGKCYDIKTPSTLDLTAWTTGKWYEIKRYENLFEKGTDCATHVYFLNSGSSIIDDTFSFRHSNGSSNIIQGKINYTLENNEYNLNVVYPEDSSSSAFDVLATDVSNYAVVYSCWQVSNDEFLPEKQERLWVLSRVPTMTNSTLEIVKKALIVNGTDLGRYLDDVSQENCP